MCLATEHYFVCVGCDRFITGTMTIDQFCRRKEDVDETVGRFVFPGTDDLIIFPKTGQKADHYEGQADERAAADAGLHCSTRTADSLIAHRYFQALLDFVRPRFCKYCLLEKYDRDASTSKQLNRSLARIHRDDIDTTYARHLKGEQATDGKAGGKTEKHVNIFEGEWCYYLPVGYNSKPYEQKRIGWKDNR